MPIPLIEFKYAIYPVFQAEGNAAQFAIPYAKKVCKGCGVDVGAGQLEWAFPGAIIIDPKIADFGYPVDALHFPRIISPGSLDYVFSSHCLEHIPDWVRVLDYWKTFLKPGGVMFLYLPDFSQVYWRPWHNCRHLHAFTPEIIATYFRENAFRHIFVSGVDLNNSFMVMAENVL